MAAMVLVCVLGALAFYLAYKDDRMVAAGARGRRAPVVHKTADAYSELLVDLDYYGDDRHVSTPAEQRRRVRRAAAALRAVIAERDG
jgi:hypothetical protein